MAAGHDGTAGGNVRRTVLPGGLRVVTEAIPTLRSATFGIWCSAGSRDETPEVAGASHFLEHLLFKGTPRRDALAISSAIDAVGGEMNAFTTKEYTCYYARVLDADLPLAVDVVSDMLTSSLVTQADVDGERGVVLEEIAMRDDDPGDLIHDVFSEHLFGDTPIGRPVLGTDESIEAMSRDAVYGYYRDRYTPGELVVAAAGNLDHDRVVELVSAAFADVLAGRPASQPGEVRPAEGGVAAREGVVVVDRPTEQAHLLLGGVGLIRTDERRFALGVLNGVLGGGMSSRLFQEVREKRGLAYSVYSFTTQYADTGMWGVYAGCQPKRADEVLEICLAELEKAATGGITAEELARGKGQMRGGLVLGLEDSGSRMSRLGKSELVYGEQLPVDELLRKIDAVTLDGVAAVAAEVLSAPPALAVIGPFGDREFPSFAGRSAARAARRG